MPLKDCRCFSLYMHALCVRLSFASKIVVSSRAAAPFADCNAGLQSECKDCQSLWALNFTVAF